MFSIFPIGLIVTFVVTCLFVIFVRYHDRLEKTCISLLFNIIACAFSVITTRFLVKTFISLNEKRVFSFIGDMFGKDLMQVEVIKGAVMFAATVILSTFLVGLIHIAMLIIMLAIKNFIVFPKLKINAGDEYDSKLTSKKLLSMVATVATVFITFTFFITPMGFFYNIIPMMREEIGYEEDVPKMMRMPFVSEKLFDELTETKYDGEKISTSNEIKLTFKFAAEVEKIGSGKTDEINEKAIEDTISKAHYLPDIIPDVVATGAEHWKKGEEFLSFQYDVPEGREGKLYIDVLSILEDWNKDSVIEDIKTTVDVSELLADNGINEVNDITDKDKLLNLLSDEKFLEDLFVKLYKNKDFAKLIPGVVEYGIGTTFDKIGIELYSGYNSTIDITKLSEDQIRAEAKIVAGIIKSSLKVYEMSQDIQDVNEYVQKVEELVDEVTKLKDSKIWGEIATEVTEQLKEKFGDNMEILKAKINEFGGKIDSIKIWED